MAEHTFKCKVEWVEGKKAILDLNGKGSIEFSYPPVFGGLEGFTYPEELFIASVNACTLTSFLYFAERLSLKFKSYSCEAEGIVVKQPEGFHRFTRIILKPQITLEKGEDPAKAAEVFEYVRRFCIISRSIENMVTIELQPEITIE
ncbi:OsmC family peroxiredoxin [Candidatus Bathyarchaeota archaeon]|nr:MAG: OsmC family peroxiredoxin [Candidatus Bathyarchaeota archaeon]